MLKRSPTSRANHRVNSKFNRINTMSAKELTELGKGSPLANYLQLALPPLTPMPVIEESSRLMPSGSARALNAKPPPESLSKNIKRLTFKKAVNLSTPTTPRGYVPAGEHTKFKNNYIDNFYPNGSESKFTNNVPLPGDWNFNKKMYEDKKRYKARDLEFKKTSTEKETPFFEFSKKRISLTVGCSLIESLGTAPELLKQSSMVHACGKIYVYGGQQHGRFYGLYSFNTRNHNWACHTTANAPAFRSGHTMVSYKDKLVVFGGIIKHRKQMPPAINTLHIPSLTLTP